MEEGKTIINNHFAEGANCQVFNSPVSGCVFAMPGAHVVQQSVPQNAGTEEGSAAGMDEQHEDIVEQLRPAFFGIEKDAREFLQTIQRMTPEQITDTVKEWVKGRRISDKSKNRFLWRVLKENGFYTRSESNWNQMIRG